ncbi:putative 2-carboxy-D-arabinitol-1-phosphatase [Glycine soja]|uniref:Putative 2-carboxy-D-arabinitol-1-phosphatase n=1 Tax=Glycine soja TaxID=3848 RepID=A0A445I474_GLYSO|nr:putative 2-carboxy-D-arabinitol-1-phosphatase [Glycine soja]
MMFLVVRPCGSSSARIHHHHPTPPRGSRNVVVRCSVSSSVQEKEEKGTELDCSVSFPPIRAAKRVVLVRHGQSTWNAEGRIQGSSNFSVLTKKGESQAETSRQMLIDDHFDACFASPLARSKRTAEIIWGPHHEPIIPDYDFREIDLYSFQDDGEIEGDVNHRIQAGWMKWRKASGVLCDAKVPIKLKGKFYRTAVRPAILYGTECWAVKSQHETKVGVAEMRMLRWMCGKTRQDKIRNGAIRERVGVAPIVEKMVENRLRWFGHVERRPVDSVVRRVDQMERRQTIRGRGRPKKTIREVIKKDLELNDLDRNMGLLKHEGKERFGSAFRQWQVDAANFNIDGHYPVRELWDRARSCWTKILAHDSRSVLVVAHNAVNQALVATAIGLGPEYFRTLLQSNCGVSVLDFIPRSEGGSPHICLNRLNQTPGSSIAGGKSGGREPSKRIILICNGSTQGNTEDVFPFGGDQPLNMLGVIQSQKSAELLLDLKVNSIISSLNKACIGTATIISQVQEAADCLGADCVPRYVEMKQMGSFDVETIFKQTETASNAISNFPPFQPGWLNRVDDGLRTKLWDQSRKAWQSLLDEISDESNPEVVVAVGHPAIHIALMGHCLNLTKEWLGSFHLDAGSVSLVDFPDGPKGKGVIRCLNYTAHLGRWSIPITRSTEDGEEF